MGMGEIGLIIYRPLSSNVVTERNMVRRLAELLR